MNQPPLEAFLAACGSSETLRIGIGQRDQLPTETWTFRQPFLVIGRRPESDLMLDHWQVSRRHTYLQLIGGRYYCVDLGSRTGTHGGDAAERSGWMERGRAIQIGPFAVRPEWPPVDPGAAPVLPAVTWELPGRAIGQAVWRMDRQLVLIGRSPACRIRIVEPDVSKFHCSLVLTPLGVWVVDLLGQKGVFVNGEAVRCARLDDGDELRVGRHALRARYETPPPALAAPEPPRLVEPVELAEPIEPDGPAEPAVPARAGLATIVPPAGRGLLEAVPRWSPPPSREVASFVEHGGAIADPMVSAMMQQFGMMQQQMFDQFHQTMMMMFEGFAALHREQSSTLREEFEQVRKLSREIEELRAETARLADAARRPVPPNPAPNGHYGPGRFAPPPGPGRGTEPGPDPIRRAIPPPPDPEVDIHAQLCLRLASIQGERQNRWQKILGMMSSRS